jgi:DNA replication licensing factor MCM3
VTVRSLETVIRLATAHAKLRLSRSVTTDDIDEAMKMVKRSIFSEKDPEDDIGEPQNEDQDMMT